MRKETGLGWVFALVLLVCLPMLVLGVTAIRGLEASQAQATLAAATHLASLADTGQSNFATVFNQRVQDAKKHLEHRAQQGNALLALPYTAPYVYAFASYKRQDTGFIRVFPSEASVGQLFIEQRRLAELEHSFLTTLNQSQGQVAKDNATYNEQPNGMIWARKLSRTEPVGCWLGQRNERYYCVAFSDEIIVDTLVKDFFPSMANQPAGTYVQVTNGPQRWGDVIDVTSQAHISRSLPLPLVGWTLSLSADRQMVNQENQFGVWLTWILFGLVGVLLSVIALFIYSRYRWQLRLYTEQLAMSRQIAHDFKTPLANMMLYAELIDQRKSNPSDVSDYCEIIAQEVRRLESLVTRSLKAAKPTNDQTVVIQTRLDEICRLYSASLSASGCSIIYGQQVRDAYTLDASCFDRIIVNLIDNACKYAPGSVIQINSFVAANMLVLEFRDNGEHLTQEKVAAIVALIDSNAGAPAKPPKPEAQLSNAATKIGLNGCRQLCEQNGGYMIIDFANPGLRVQIALVIGEVT